MADMVPARHLDPARIALLARLHGLDVQRASAVTVLEGRLTRHGEHERDEIIAAAAARLAPGDLLAVEYDALPGWAPLLPARELLVLGAARAAGGGTDAQVAAGRAVLDRARALNGGSGTYGRLLGALAKRAGGLSDDRLAQHDLAPSLAPLWVDEVAALAAEHGLSYVGEAFPQHWWEADLRTAGALRGRVADDPVQAQKVADLILGPLTKCTVFALDPAVPRAPLRLDAATGAVVHLEDPGLHSHALPVVQSIARAVAVGGSAFAEVAATVDADPDLVAEMVLALTRTGALDLRWTESDAPSE